MKQIIIDLVGVCGFCALAAGIYLKFGLSYALMVSGVLLIIFAIKAN